MDHDHRVRLEAQEAAEDYRGQRQAADARRQGMPEVDREAERDFIEGNNPLLLEIAKRSGVSKEEAPGFVKDLRASLAALPPKSKFDDLGGLVQRAKIQGPQQTSSVEPVMSEKCRWPLWSSVSSLKVAESIPVVRLRVVVLGPFSNEAIRDSANDLN